MVALLKYGHLFMTVYDETCSNSANPDQTATGKMVKKKSLQGKIREFEILLKIREKSGNFRKIILKLF